MKRLGLTLVAAICLATASFAADNQPTSTVKWEGNINITKLGRYLDLDREQADKVSDISSFFSDQMSRASRARKDQDKMFRNAVYGNLKLMKDTLTPEQYSKYVQLINVTLNNKGIQIK